MKTPIRISERQSNAALLASTTAVLILVLAGVLFAAEMEAPGNLAVPRAPTTLTGSLHTLYGDAPDGRHMHTHMLVDDKGRATKIEVPDSVIAAAGGRAAINHRRVTVRGQSLSALPSAGSGGASRFEVDAIAVDGSATSSLPAASPLGAEALVSGSQKWVSILCRFSDSAGVTPYPKEWFETLMLGGTAPGLDHYWREASFGTVNLTGSVVLGWYTLPQPRSYYVYGNPLQLNSQRAAEDCTGAADANVYFPSFVGINLMFNDDLDCCAWGGSTYLNLDGQSRMYRVTWLPPWGYESQGPVAHEMGHGFGLPHSSGPYNATYDSRWDVMSDVWGNCLTWDPTYGCVGTHTISYHKDLLGWIPSNRRYVAALGTSQTITLEPLDQLSSSGYMTARIPLPGSSTRFYTVETRRVLGAGYDAKLPGHAVIIHLVDTTRADRDAQIVDPDANGNPDDAGAMWLPGEAFVDSANGISVAVNSATPQGFSVTVSNGSSAPAGVADITVSPLLLDYGNVAVGTKSAGKTVTVRNDGVTALVLGTVALVGLNPDQFKVVVAANLCAGRTLAAGQSCTVMVKLSPTTSGLKTAKLRIPSSDPDKAVVKVNLNGTASGAVAPPEITVTPASVPFGSVVVGVKSFQVVTVKNDGTANLVLGATGLSTATSEIALAVGQDLCSGVTLAPGQSCTITMKIKATTSGPKAATLSIPSNDADENVVSVSVTATAS